MPRNVYSEINLHITWHTKDNSLTLVEQIEHHTHKFLKHRALQTPGVIVHAINGMPDHIHLAITIPPTLGISDWIGKLKGSCAYHINHEITNAKSLHWQSGYGVVSFGTKDLPWVIRYVENQKEHHASRTLYERLEYTERQEDAPPSGKPVETG